MLIIRNFEASIAYGELIDSSFLKDLLRLIQEDDAWIEEIKEQASHVRESLNLSPLVSIYRELNNLRHSMLNALEKDWADWDAQYPRDGFPGTGRIKSSVLGRVYLDDLRSPFNVGSIARTAQAFGIEKIWISPDCVSLDHQRARRSAMLYGEGVPWSVKEMNELTSEDCGIIYALETGGIDISEFRFPETGTVILGSEELGVSPPLMNRAVAGGWYSEHIPSRS